MSNRNKLSITISNKIEKLKRNGIKFVQEKIEIPTKLLTEYTIQKIEFNVSYGKAIDSFIYQILTEKITDDETPDSDEETPDSDEETPDSDDETPDSDDEETPDSDEETPDSDEETPDSDEEYTESELKNKTVKELRKIAKIMSLKGYSRMKKVDLINFIKS